MNLRALTSSATALVVLVTLALCGIHCAPSSLLPHFTEIDHIHGCNHSSPATTAEINHDQDDSEDAHDHNKSEKSHSHSCQCPVPFQVSKLSSDLLLELTSLLQISFSAAIWLELLPTHEDIIEARQVLPPPRSKSILELLYSSLSLTPHGPPFS